MVLEGVQSTEDIALGAELQIVFQSLTILLKYEASNVEVLQRRVFKLSELLCLVRPCVTKETKLCTFKSVYPYKHL